MSTPKGLILSLCPGLDLWTRPFEEAGFCVVRGGEPVWGQPGIETFHPPAAVFDGVMAGIPCQPFSVARNGREEPPSMPDLTKDVARVIEESGPRWFLTENVPRAPLVKVNDYDITSRVLWAWDLGVRQRRPRRFTIGARTPTLILWPQGERSKDPLPTATSRGLWTSSRVTKGQGMWGDESTRETPWPLLLEAFGLPPDYDAKSLLRSAIRLAIANSVPLPVAYQLLLTIERSFY